MPLPISARAQARRSASPSVRKDGTLDYLRPDGKTQVSVRYQRRPARRDRAAPDLHPARRGVDREAQIKHDLWEHVVEPVLARDGASTTRPRCASDFLVNPTGTLRHRRPRRRRRPHRPQDHRRHLRRHGPPRRRRLLRQGPVEGRPLRRLRRPLRRQERRRRRPRRPLRGPGRLRDRRRAPGLGHGRDLRHREDRPTPSIDDARPRALRPAPGRVPRATSTCTARSTRRPPPTATSAATTTTSPGSAPTRPRRCAQRAGLGNRGVGSRWRVRTARGRQRRWHGIS